LGAGKRRWDVINLDVLNPVNWDEMDLGRSLRRASELLRDRMVAVDVDVAVKPRGV